MLDNDIYKGLSFLVKQKEWESFDALIQKRIDKLILNFLKSDLSDEEIKNIHIEGKLLVSVKKMALNFIENYEAKIVEDK